MSDLRILSGRYKGIKLESPSLKTTHPMGSREKLALFNMLTPYLEGATVLDYFAGSGALGLEALSRGAHHVTFAENNSKARKTIKENCSRCELGVDVVISADLKQATPITYDLIISDPPYDHYQVVDYAALLKSGGILALSHPATFDPKTITGLTLLKTNHYAACNISLFQK